jgi:NAD-dependent dihydropyrimidine dehydrogenase PreA subunit
MPFVVTEACIGTKDRACVDVCPVDCIYEGADQLYINPDECIDCGACEPECPVTAIFPEDNVPPALARYVQINRAVFESETPPVRPVR